MSRIATNCTWCGSFLYTCNEKWNLIYMSRNECLTASLRIKNNIQLLSGGERPIHWPHLVIPNDRLALSPTRCHNRYGNVLWDASLREKRALRLYLSNNVGTRWKTLFKFLVFIACCEGNCTHFQIHYHRALSLVSCSFHSMHCLNAVANGHPQQRSYGPLWGWMDNLKRRNQFPYG